MRAIKRALTVYPNREPLLVALVDLIDQICWRDGAAFRSPVKGSSLCPLCLCGGIRFRGSYLENAT
jgi:hypothetical protein